jgi:hypothetical protein
VECYHDILVLHTSLSSAPLLPTCLRLCLLRTLTNCLIASAV